MTRIIGIDPGLDGALAVLVDENVLGIYDMPTLKVGKGTRRALDERELYGIIRAEAPVKGMVTAYVEDQIAMPKQASQSTAKTFQGLGTIIGILTALEIPLLPVRPAAWKKSVLAGYPKGKDASIQFCRRMFPEVELVPSGCRKASDGRADAICIALHGSRLRT